ncbi:MAG: zinc-dependent alcohol dehydrogenase [Candidatus Hodarchaeales archaeon]
MKAAVYSGSGNIRVEEVDDPVPGSDEVLLRPRYCEFNEIDLKSWEKIGKLKPGIIIGKEFSAEIVGVGRDVIEWKKGDRVVVDPIVSCKKCRFCKEGKYSHCNNLKVVGLTINGGFSELTVVPSENLFLIPDDVNLKAATFAEPLASVLQGFNKARLKPGQTVLVLGANTLGLLAVQVARTCGASLVVVADPNSTCRNLAGRLGAMYMLDSASSSLAVSYEESVNDLTADLVVSTTRNPALVAQIFTMTRKCGKTLIMNAPEAMVEADFITGVFKEITVLFKSGSHMEIQTALDLISKGVIDTSNLITKVIDWKDILEKGFDQLSAESSGCVKTLVKI